MIEGIYNGMGAVIGFTVIVLLCENFVSPKFAQNMILIVLFGMLILNSGNIVNLAKKITGGNDDGNS